MNGRLRLTASKVLLCTLLVLGAINVRSESAPLHPMAEKVRDSAAAVATEIAKHVKDPSPLLSYLDSFKTWLDEQTGSFKSMVEWSDVERVTNNVKWLDGLNPPKLESLFAKSRLAEYAMSGDSTIVTGAAALRRMQNASDRRTAEIQQLKDQKTKLVELRDTYSKADETIGKISDKLEALVGNVPVEIACLIEGHSLPMSWYDLSEELRPVMAAGADAAKGAIDRLDAEISSDETDLKSFNEARTLIGMVWNDVAAAPGANSIHELQRQMKQQIEETDKQAAEFRRRAGEIANANARIDAIKRLLAAGTNLSQLAATGAKWPHGASEPSDRSSILIGPDVPPPSEQKTPSGLTPAPPGGLRTPLE